MRRIADFKVQDAASYRGNFPTFTQPKEVACFSRSADRSVTFDRKALRPYRAPVLPAEQCRHFILDECRKLCCIND